MSDFLDEFDDASGDELFQSSTTNNQQQHKPQQATPKGMD
jgi:hypothetical protein